MTGMDSPPPAPVPRAPQTLHQFSLNNPALQPLPEAEHLLRDLGRDPVRGGVLHGTRISRGPLLHVVGIRAEPPGETLTGREGQLLEGLMEIQHARAGRYTLLGLGMHPILKGEGGAANSQCLRIRVIYGTEDEGEELFRKILSLLPYLVAVSAASPFVEGRLEPAADNRLLQMTGDIPPIAGAGAGTAPDAASLVKGFDPGLFERAHKVGIRPQLVDWRTKELVMDFLVAARDESVHVLNPISPAFTSSMDLARTVVQEHFRG